jgi:hypothetical protein
VLQRIGWALAEPVPCSDIGERGPRLRVSGKLLQVALDRCYIKGVELTRSAGDVSTAAPMLLVAVSYLGAFVTVPRQDHCCFCRSTRQRSISCCGALCSRRKEIAINWNPASGLTGIRPRREAFVEFWPRMVRDGFTVIASPR